MSSQPPPPDDDGHDRNDRVSEFFAGIADGFARAADEVGDALAVELDRTDPDVPPRVYLDVDGVLNAYNSRGTDPPPTDDDYYNDFTAADVTVDGVAYPITWSPRMCANLTEAVADADVAWLTSWRQLASERLAPLFGLPDWPHIPHPRGGDKVRGVVLDLLDRPRPFVWIDDLLRHGDGLTVPGADPDGVRQGLTRDAGIAMPPHLLIAPDPHTGLRPSEIRRIADFIAEVGP